MDFIVTFFRDVIDGWLYYVILVVNTILIFAIIGYLGEKKNEELMRLTMNTQIPTKNSTNLDFNPNTSNVSRESMSIPSVSATRSVINEPQNTSNVNNPANIVNPPVMSNTPTPVDLPQSGVIPAQTAVPINASPEQVANNNMDSNEKAPSVLVINSDGTSEDVK